MNDKTHLKKETPASHSEEGHSYLHTGKKNSPKNRVNFLAFIFVCLLFIFFITNKDTYQAPAHENNTPPAHAVEESGLTLVEFAENYNRLSEEQHLKSRFTDFQLQTAHGITKYKGCVTDDLCVVGELNEFDEMKTLMVHDKGSLTIEDRINMLMFYPMIVSATNPALSPIESEKIVLSLDLLTLHTNPQPERHNSYQGLDYAASFYDNMESALFIFLD